MKTIYTDVRFKDGIEVAGPKKTVELPFKRISARAIILRKRDRAILGTLHRKGGMFALPGGSLENNESCDQAAARELAEEKISLIQPDPDWRQNIAVDYFPGYQEFNLWYLIPVQDAEIGSTDENIETKWFSQEDDVWYPGMREKIILAIMRLKPELAKISVMAARAKK